MNSLRWRLSFSQNKSSRPLKIVWQEFSQVFLKINSFHWQSFPWSLWNQFRNLFDLDLWPKFNLVRTTTEIISKSVGYTRNCYWPRYTFQLANGIWSFRAWLHKILAWKCHSCIKRRLSCDRGRIGFDNLWTYISHLICHKSWA